MLTLLTDNLALWAQGLQNTVTLTLLSALMGFSLALPLALARLSRNRTISGMAYGYVYLMRGTPLLVQVFLIYYGLGSFSRELRDIGLWWFFRDAFYCGLLAFALNSAAYQAEILRGGIQAVPRGTIEAGRVLGLSTVQIFRKIVLPIATARMLPTIGNELVLLLKASAIVSVITVPDIMGQARSLYAQSFDLTVFYVAALNYLAVVLLIEALWRRLEGRNRWLHFAGTV